MTFPTQLDKAMGRYELISSRSLYINRARIQKAISITVKYLHSRGMQISPAQSAAIAFTRKDTRRYPILIEGTPIEYVEEHTFLGVTLHRSLSWSPHIRRIKQKLKSFTQIIKMISGTRWGCSARALMTLYNALFVGLLRYSISVMHGISKSSMKDLESVQAQALKVCLGLPKCTSNIGTLVEARAISPGILRTQETIRVHLRHQARSQAHHLANITEVKPSARFSQVISQLQGYIPNDFELAKTPQQAPWTCSSIDIKLNIPGVTQKAATPTPVMMLLTLEYIHHAYLASRHIYTDGSTNFISSSIGAYIPSTGTTIKTKLSHITSSTAAELAAIRAAAAYISTQNPQNWTIFVDSKSALSALMHKRKNNVNAQLIYDILQKFHDVRCQGHEIVLQWVPGHSRIPGNICADKAASDAHEADNTCAIPLSRTDAMI